MTEPRSSLIVPLMKARVPAEVQLEFPLPPEEEPVRDPFAGDLYVTYALEVADEAAPLGRRYEHVARRHCAELGVVAGELRRLATINLRNRRPDLSLSWYPDVRAVTVTLGDGGPTAAPAGPQGGRRARQGGLEAALLLDEGFLEKLAQDVEGDLVVAAPARDVFVASGTGHPDGVDKLRWAVAQVWAQDRGDGADPAWDVPAGSLLTHELMVRRGATWETLAG
ncbi:DUF1444 domain-containing protein [Actinomadura sp. NEAU-AAG7]|uniref:DUF1444 domain-containing protein n=1 Tax=Actinomadura sp. NEAU-AAG7 TaxID=2839640 RepID=UPI001BE4AF8B|nr:DUF1444 domain-containing protein [Actinomadura sp. NEAU-AAG7]MBT2208682.1 DUF1444 domain-containing protein [Actinomadura sp. NEAU-AAG7]